VFHRRLIALMRFTLLILLSGPPLWWRGGKSRVGRLTVSRIAQRRMIATVVRTGRSFKSHEASAVDRSFSSPAESAPGSVMRTQRGRADFQIYLTPQIGKGPRRSAERGWRPCGLKRSHNLVPACDLFDVRGDEASPECITVAAGRRVAFTRLIGLFGDDSNRMVFPAKNRDRASCRRRRIQECSPESRGQGAQSTAAGQNMHQHRRANGTILGRCAPGEGDAGATVISMKKKNKVKGELPFVLVPEHHLG